MTQPGDQILDQKDIDLLIAGLRSGEVPLRKSSLAPLHDVKPIDFADPSWSQDRIIRRRLPVLELVFERLAPSIQVTLTKSLRFPVRAENTPIELLKFGDFKERFDGKPTVFEVMRLDPLRGFSVVVFEPGILFALLDALMGGLGIAELPDGREISDIEIGLLNKVHADVLRDLENAWRPWFPLRCEHVRADRNSSFLSSLPDDEVCHVGKIIVTGDVLPRYPVYFVLPYATLEPLHDAISAGVGDEIDPNWRSNLQEHARRISVEVSATLGQTMLPAQRVHDFAPGDVIELPIGLEDDVSVEVGGDPVFLGRFGRSNANYGVRITGAREVERRQMDRTMGQVLVRKGLITREQLAVAEVDEMLNRRMLLDSIAARGWVEKRVLETALAR